MFTATQDVQYKDEYVKFKSCQVWQEGGGGAGSGAAAAAAGGGGASRRTTLAQLLQRLGGTS